MDLNSIFFEYWKLQEKINNELNGAESMGKIKINENLNVNEIPSPTSPTDSEISSINDGAQKSGKGKPKNARNCRKGFFFRRWR